MLLAFHDRRGRCFFLFNIVDLYKKCKHTHTYMFFRLQYDEQKTGNLGTGSMLLTLDTLCLPAENHEARVFDSNSTS